MHKTFISYHHDNDQDLKDLLIKKFGGDEFIDKSVGEGDIKTTNTDETIMRTIRDDFLETSTVTLVIVGSETAQRPFVNSEIQASLWGDNPNGLIAVVRDEIYDLIYNKEVCNFPACNCGIQLRTRTHLFDHYIPDLVKKNNIIEESVPHYSDDEVYCSILKFSNFVSQVENQIDTAYEKKRQKHRFEIKKKLDDNTPRIRPKQPPTGTLLWRI